MTPPMTPREKVVFKQPCEHCQRMTTVDLTALASGSGDHAELEVVAWRVQDLILPQQTFTTDEAYARHRADYRYEGEVTATVEPLVTAASAEARMRELRSAYCAAESEAMTLRKRAAEAERKLAEARAVIDEISETAQITRVRHLARTFLSKEDHR